MNSDPLALAASRITEAYAWGWSTAWVIYGIAWIIFGGWCSFTTHGGSRGWFWPWFWMMLGGGFLLGSLQALISFLGGTPPGGGM